MQDNFLFRGTVRDNIIAGRPGLTLEDAVRAARLAGAEEFIERLPRGYETWIEEGSANLSGGQRQRLAIARALVSDPRLLILDEATSALDPESEALVNANLLRIAKGRTMIIVSHRLSSLVDCDQILVLDKGKVADIGPHEELLERCAVYRQLWQQQHRHMDGGRQRSLKVRHDPRVTIWPAPQSSPATFCRTASAARGHAARCCRRYSSLKSPTAALIEAPVKPAARSILWTIVSAVVASMAVAGLFPIDMVVTGAGRVVSLQATNVVQPLETAIVRAINVREGQTVRAGEVLARLDPTFSGADASALQAQVKSFQAEVDRLTAEASGTPYQPTSADASTALQVAIYGQRQAQYRYQMESYNQKISGLQAQLTRAEHDVKAFAERVQIAIVLESKRRELERLQVGSQMNRMIAEDQRIEMQRNLTDAKGAAERARRDLQQMMAERDGFEQQWKAKISEELTLRTRSLSDASESLRKATLRRELVDLRADQDAVVLTVAKVSVGSVMQSGEQLITLVPTNAPLEVETRIAAADAGYVHPGQKVAIKFDTFPFVQYGMAEGTVRFISPDSFSGSQETQRGSVVTQGDSSDVFYKARVAIDELKMHGVPGGFELKPGMTVTADIKAGERTLLTYLFARILPVGARRNARTLILRRLTTHGQAMNFVDRLVAPVSTSARARLGSRASRVAAGRPRASVNSRALPAAAPSRRSTGSADAISKAPACRKPPAEAVRWLERAAEAGSAGRAVLSRAPVCTRGQRPEAVGRRREGSLS